MVAVAQVSSALLKVQKETSWTTPVSQFSANAGYLIAHQSLDEEGDTEGEGGETSLSKGKRSLKGGEDEKIRCQDLAPGGVRWH